MSDQLQLAIRERVSYSAANFVEHGGLTTLCETYRECLEEETFRIFFVVGGRRCGKTHTAISFSEWAVANGLLPHILDGEGFGRHLKTDESSQRSVVIVDDADQYLRTVLPGQSGNFVSFVERHRVLGSKIVLFSSIPIEELPCDEHVLSRLMPGVGFSLEPPPEEDVTDVLFALAKQRGMKLSKKKLGYVSRRVSRDIRSLEEYLDRVYQLARARGESAHFPVLADAL